MALTASTWTGNGTPSVRLGARRRGGIGESRPQAGFADFAWAAGSPDASRACLRLARRYFTPSMVRKAVTTAIRMGAVCRAPTWVRNAAIRTIANGAATSAPTVAASRQVNASPSGTLGMTWWTMTPAVPPMNSDGKWPAHEAAAQADGEREHLGDERGGDQAQA